MCDVEVLRARTFARKIPDLHAVSEAEGILKFALVEAESLFGDRDGT